MKFRELNVGDKFDFVNDVDRRFNSFYNTCTKISARKYSWDAPEYLKNGTYTKKNGKPLIVPKLFSTASINAEVFHVERKPSE